MGVNEKQQSINWKIGGGRLKTSELSGTALYKNERSAWMKIIPWVKRAVLRNEWISRVLEVPGEEQALAISDS